MITIARIIEAFMNAEQFDFPTDPRSFLWHALKIPHYASSIFSLWAYGLISRKWTWGKMSYLKSQYLAFGILAADILIAWFAFEFFLDYFRNRLND